MSPNCQFDANINEEQLIYFGFCEYCNIWNSEYGIIESIAFQPTTNGKTAFPCRYSRLD